MGKTSCSSFHRESGRCEENLVGLIVRNLGRLAREGIHERGRERVRVLELKTRIDRKVIVCLTIL